MASIQKPVTKIVEYPEREMSIKALTIQPDLMQTRAGTDPRVVNVYSRAKANGSVFPPVVVFHTPEDEYLLADGFTRVAAWQSLRLPSIWCVIREGTREEAILFGIDANFNPDNIREVTPDDRKHAAEIMIRNETFRSWSDLEIGRRCGISNGTIGRIRLTLETKEGIPLPTKVIKFKDGAKTGVSMQYRTPGRVLGKLSGICKVSGTGGGGYKMHLDGKSVFLGKDLEEAERKRLALLSGRGTIKSALTNCSKFRIWLITRSVIAECLPRFPGGIVIGDAVMFPVMELTTQNVLAVLGKSVLVRSGRGQNTRIVMIGYFDAAPGMAGTTVTLARKLTPPIEFMTPEEVVAEFGPKGADGRPIEPADEVDDASDAQAASDAMRDAAEHGTVPWDEVKNELGLTGPADDSGKEPPDAGE